MLIFTVYSMVTGDAKPRPTDDPVLLIYEILLIRLSQFRRSFINLKKTSVLKSVPFYICRHLYIAIFMWKNQLKIGNTVYGTKIKVS